ncbi:hypothetical protein [Kriegella aquimaris]|uniref:Uncharacterized protein n=1 Tax=Kriegella aquimaris TaxID=192904 RepID=A0A1G9IJA4_9FLAO|nr:hypothetical protein [Kriegella aquimaris]SDL24993.1 hypothetical protein SAMN04488514_101154 [Kriegella aquimaris]
MNRLKELKYFILATILFSFVAAGSLSSCRDQKKQENTEQQGEHPEGEEHPTEAGEAKEEHPTKGAEEHPSKDEGEHPKKDGE